MNTEIYKEVEEEVIDWERYGPLARLKVNGGHIYESTFEYSNALVFVPDIDLKRYESHLRDAYNKGYKDGQEDTKRHIDRFLEE